MDLSAPIPIACLVFQYLLPGETVFL